MHVVTLHCRSDGWGPADDDQSVTHNPANSVPVHKWVALQQEGYGRNTREMLNFEATLDLRNLKRTADRRLPAFKALRHNTRFSTDVDQDVRRWTRKMGDVFQVSTVKVDPSHIEATLYFTDLASTEADCVPREVKTLGMYGSLPQFRPVEGEGEIRLTPEELAGVGPRMPIIEDPIVNKLVDEISADPAYEGMPLCVVSDEVLATLMASPKSVQGWDVHVFKGSMPVEPFAPLIVIDRSEKGGIDSSWINETGNADDIPPPGSLLPDDREQLCEESTRLNFAFRRFCCSPTATAQPPGKVSALPEELAGRHGLFVYRLFTMFPDSPERHLVLVRGEIDCGEKGSAGGKSETRYYQCGAFLEFRPKVRGNVQDPWAQLKDKKRTAAAQLMLEQPRNAFKMAKWTAMAYLAKADMKIGFVRRRLVPTSVEVRDQGKVRVQVKKEPSNQHHNVIAVESVSTENFAGQIGVHFNQMWTTFAKILRTIHRCNSDMIGIAKLGEERSNQLVFFRRSSDDAAEEDAAAEEN